MDCVDCVIPILVHATRGLHLCPTLYWMTGPEFHLGCRGIERGDSPCVIESPDLAHRNFILHSEAGRRKQRQLLIDSQDAMHGRNDIKCRSRGRASPGAFLGASLERYVSQCPFTSKLGPVAIDGPHGKEKFGRGADTERAGGRLGERGELRCPSHDG